MRRTCNSIFAFNASFLLFTSTVSLLTACQVSVDYKVPIELASLTPTPTAPVVSKSLQKIATGSGHTCAILNSGAVKCWGSNSAGQLGYDDTVDRGKTAGDMAALANVNLGAGRTAQAIALGGAFTCAILDTGAVKCWGRNWNGQLGYDDFASRGHTAGSMASLATVNIGAGRTAKAISAGNSHVCVILDTNAVKCWGNGGDGQLGNDSADSGIGDGAGEMAALGTVNLGAGRTAKMIAAGGISTCAILDNDQVKCWGFNGEGHLGYDHYINRGDTPGQMAALGTVNLGAGRTAKAISINETHTCAILDTGAVKCWGASYYGETGYEDYNWRGGASGDMAALTTVFLGAGRTAKEIQSGGTHTCAILDNDAVKCWGDNSSGQLGYDDTTERGSSAGTMTSLTSINLGSGRSAKNISIGYDFSCALLDNNEAKCWGNNSSGQLGYDSTTAKGKFAGDMAALNSINVGD
ncbi:RCC1 domain-containing protein [Bdellovibrio svalbardensis]|uniref:RCC1-like domain-containing protein n=1 Tax=Bdellovibrio svalbardensis TaxID=2972972 RepID=A0ABT6DPS8_9BACT|nr:hypothetical protein [Bdellovibrio svalbardensis]MDG0818060.1 hypothetical protein [Bdellovibrio svalbardensis]